MKNATKLGSMMMLMLATAMGACGAVEDGEETPPGTSSPYSAPSLDETPTQAEPLAPSAVLAPEPARNPDSVATAEPAAPSAPANASASEPVVVPSLTIEVARGGEESPLDLVRSNVPSRLPAP